MVDPELNSAHIPPLEVVTNAYTDVLNYNRRHTGLGVAMVNMMRAMIEADEEPIADDSEEVQPNIVDITDAASVRPEWAKGIQKRIDEGEMQADLQDMMHSGTFEQIGVKIMPFGITVGNENADIANRELTPHIVNTELFVDFLGSLDKETLHDSTDKLSVNGWSTFYYN